MYNTYNNAHAYNAQSFLHAKICVKRNSRDHRVNVIYAYTIRKLFKLFFTSFSTECAAILLRSSKSAGVQAFHIYISFQLTIVLQSDCATHARACGLYPWGGITRSMLLNNARKRRGTCNANSYTYIYVQRLWI